MTETPTIPTICLHHIVLYHHVSDPMTPTADLEKGSCNQLVGFIHLHCDHFHLLIQGYNNRSSELVVYVATYQRIAPSQRVHLYKMSYAACWSSSVSAAAAVSA